MTRFEQITVVHYRTVSHTGNVNLQFFLKSQKLRKKMIAEVHKLEETEKDSCK